MDIFRRKKPANTTSKPAVPPPSKLAFGGRVWDSDELDPHFVFVGATGSGKTRNVRMLMRSALFDADGQLRRRAIIFDAKKEWIPLLNGMKAPSVVGDKRKEEKQWYKILNPLDRRRVSWDIASDVSTRIATRQLAEYLIPTNENISQPYFTDSARLVLGAVLNTFTDRAPGEWTLRDVIEACRTTENLDRVLGAESYGKAVHERFIRVRSGPEIEATLLSRLGAFTEVAACGHEEQSNKRISLQAWLDDEEPSILLIATDEQADAALGPLNQMLFRRLFELLSSRPEQPREGGEPVWVFIDEARLAGKLDGIDHVLLKGRSKGVHVVLTCQEVQGLHHVYGRERAEELLSQCTNRAALRTSNAETKSWFTKSIGEQEDWKTSYTETHSSQPSSSQSQSIKVESPILGSEFAALPRPSKEGGIAGFFDIPGQGWQRVTVSPEFITRHQGRDPDGADEGFIPWPDAQRQVLQPWTDDDLVMRKLRDVEPLSRTSKLKWHNMLDG